MTNRGCSNSTIAPPVPRRFPVTPQRLLAGICALGILLPSSGFALDGRLEFRGSHQEGRAGVEAYKTDTQWQIFSLGQRIELSKRWGLSVDATARRERLWGESQFSSASTDKKSMLPNFTLSYRDDTYRFGLFGRASRIDQTGTGLPAQRDEYFDATAYLRANYGWLELDLGAKEAASWRYTQNNNRENRNHEASLAARAHLSDRDELRYKLSRIKQDAVTFNTETTYLSNNLQYRGNHDFDDNRGNFAITAIHANFNQKDHSNDVLGLQYVLPAFAGFVLDDTPEFLDPLEGDPVPVPGLIDRDQTTGTVINIGDNAPVVRDFGGDYRNIILDFGDVQEMNTLILYIDRVLRFPALMTWEIYVSDSADGRDWGTALSPAQYTITYTEWETERRGWVVQLANPINHRRIKMVNIKLGPTEPDILVTEFELYQTSVTSTPDRESTTIRQRLDGDVGYWVVPQVRVRYSGTFDRRTYDAEDRDLTGISHLVGADYHFSNWQLSGRYDDYTLQGPSNRDTDSNTKSLSLSRNRDTDLYGQLAWSQTVDNSFSANYKTSSLAADASWRIAPLLTFNQKVSYSVRSSQAIDFESDSWALVSQIRSNPKPNMNLDLRRTDRWVSQQFGTGFTTYNDSEINGSWTIRPYLNYVGQAVYQVRDEKDWLLRNSLSWAPLPGGSMLLQLHASDYQDSRNDTMRRGGGISATWKPRPRLNLSAGVEKYYEKVLGERGYPVSYQFRGYWTF